MAEPFIGEIRVFTYNFAPENWAKCDGQLLTITDYSALFALIGTTYGGDGRTTFGVPDYRSHTPIGWGNAPWGNIPYGHRGGVEFQTLPNVATHNHDFNVINKEGDQREPTNRYIAGTVSKDGGSFYSTQKNTTLHPGMLSTAGSTSPSPFTNVQPSLALNFCIALVGLFPPRN